MPGTCGIAYNLFDGRRAFSVALESLAGLERGEVRGHTVASGPLQKLLLQRISHPGAATKGGGQEPVSPDTGADWRKGAIGSARAGTIPYGPAASRVFVHRMEISPNMVKAFLRMAMAKIQQCAAKGKYAAQVKADETEGARFSVKGTPTFFFGITDPKDPSKIRAVKLLSGAVPFANFQEVLEGLLNPPKEEKTSNAGAPYG
jgi:hypothetical protein